jgi:hypothetical protein
LGAGDCFHASITGHPAGIIENLRARFGKKLICVRIRRGGYRGDGEKQRARSERGTHEDILVSGAEQKLGGSAEALAPQAWLDQEGLVQV